MIRLENVDLQAGAFALRGICFEVPAGQYAALMGKTGSGKTTILEAVIGLRRVSRGRIILDETDVTRYKPAVRGIGYMPQDAALFSTMTVREHLAFALMIRHAPAALIDRRVAALADLLGITHLLHRTPQGLSGGERQRTALGRALAFQPRVLCLDEPLSALDEETRQQMYVLLREVQSRTQVTTLHVTHSHEEAEKLADCVFYIENGAVVRSR